MRIPGFIFLFSLFSLVLRADEFQNTYGIGVIHVDLDSVKWIDFMESTEDQFPSHRMEIVRDSTSSDYVDFRIDKLKTDSIPPWFKVIYYNRNHQHKQIDFYCMISVAGKIFQTNIKCPDGQLLWLQKAPGIRFENWPEFYKSANTIHVLSYSYLKVYEQPDTTAKPNILRSVMSNESEPVMNVIEVKENWMKVAFLNPRNATNGKFIIEGWILWRNEKEPLIYFDFLNN